jgi:hypothetical protein
MRDVVEFDCLAEDLADQIVSFLKQALPSAL